MEIYTQYAEVEKKIAVLEAEKEVLRTKIAEALPPEGYKDAAVTAFWKLKRTYKYSPKVDELAKGLKETKKLEEENGTATVEEEKKQLNIIVS